MGNLDLRASKVYQILVAMTANQRERFGAFMRSPYFNTRPQLMELFEILLETVTENQPDPQKSDVYRQLFKVDKKTFVYDTKKDSHLRKLLSDLRGLTDRFLGVEGFLAQEANATFYVCESYQKMGLNRHFELLMEEALEKVFPAKAATPDLIRRHILETLQYEYFAARRNWDDMPILPGESLIVYYHIERYKQLCENIISKRLITKALLNPFGDAIPEVIPPDLVKAYPIAQFYTSFYSLLTDDKGDIDALRVFVRDTCLQIDREECRRIYHYLQNYCLGKINRGDIHARKHVLNVFLDQMLFEAEITPQQFINMIIAAVREKELAIAQQLFDTGVKKLVGDPQGTTRQYMEGYLLYANREFARARKVFKEVETLKPTFEFYLRTLEIKTWWEDESQDDEFTLNLVNNIIRHLKRDPNLSAERRKAQLVRFKYAARIIKARYEPKTLVAIQNEIQGHTGLMERDYLEERIIHYLTHHDN